MPLKEEMEGRFGADFSDVRVHSGTAARSSAEYLDARAYTLGSHIVIGDGGADKGTVAHELAHVIQQRTGTVAGTDHRGGLRLGDQASPFERAAESAAARAMSESAPPLRAPLETRPDDTPHAVSPPTIQRKRREMVRDGAPVIKVILAGSGYDIWSTHTAKKAQWKREDKESDSTTPTYYSKNKSDTNDWTREEMATAHVSFAGPGAAISKGQGYFNRGQSDVGSNSIAVLVEKVPLIVQKLITEMEEKYRDQHPVILIKAHSRGAVAASRIAQKLQEDNRDCKIELVQFDPVPGPLQPEQNQKTSLPDSIESTLVYSVSTGYTTGFTPQEVLGAKRIIISQQNHAAGLAVGFTYQGKVYKGSGLNSLPPGVYADFNDVGRNSAPLEKLDTEEGAKQKFDQAFKAAGRTSDKDRKEIVARVLNEYFKNA